jgi:hypothetical protein
MAAVQTAGPQYSQAQALIVTAFNSDLYVRTQMDVQQTPLYDEFTIAISGPLNINTSAFFVNVGANSGKGIWQSNVFTSQQLPSPEAFSIFQFRLRWSENILAADLIAILNGFVFEFSIGQKCYQRAHLWMLAAGGGPYAVTTRNAESWYTNGFPSKEAARTLILPLVISSKANFFGQFNGNPLNLSAAPGTGTIMYLTLEGLYARGVQ